MMPIFTRYLRVAFAATVIAAVFTTQMVRADDKPATCEEVLDAVTASPPADEPQALYFEMFLWDRPVGYAVYTLTPRTGADEEGYTLTYESAMHMPQSSKITGKISATLSPRFEPQEVEMVRTVVSPDGTKQRTAETARVDGDIVSLEQQIDDGPIYGNTVDVPERPFVLGLEFIIALLDPTGFAAFEIREFDPQSGTVEAHPFKTKRREEGGYRIWSTRRDGAITYDFVRLDNGRLLSIKGTMPMTMRATKKGRIDTLRRRMGKP
jgi:hypothetical protein